MIKFILQKPGDALIPCQPRKKEIIQLFSQKIDRRWAWENWELLLQWEDYCIQSVTATAAELGGKKDEKGWNIAVIVVVERTDKHPSTITNNYFSDMSLQLIHCQILQTSF